MLQPKQYLTVCLLALLVGCQAIPGTKDPKNTGEPMACECPALVDEQICSEKDAPIIADQPVKAEPQIQSCPPPVVPVTKPSLNSVSEDTMVVGRVENVYLPKKLKFKARINTGYELSSLQATEIIEFERDSKQWVRFAVNSKDETIYFERSLNRFVTVKPLASKTLRLPVVTMSFTLGSIEERVEVMLSEHHDHPYQVSIGRNFLRDRALVDVSEKFQAGLPSK
jgi:hypothetical protein